MGTPTLCLSGDVAQLVEQGTENPCVGGSIPSITTQIRLYRIAAIATDCKSVLV